MEISEFQLTRAYPTFKKICDIGHMEMKLHQIQAINWMMKRENFPDEKSLGLRGGIIADEMGLGKTFQMISLIACNFKLRTLIVLPPILIQQWIDAFKNITGHTPFVYHKKYTKKIEDLQRIQNSPIVITSYHMITSSEKKSPNILQTMKWSRIIFDEAHHLRNKKTGIFTGAMNLKTNIKWFVTGTPIQNKIKDLYSLCEIIGIPRQFYRKKENQPLIKSEFILRRTKKDVDIKLPPLQMNHVLIPVNDFENPIFDELHSILPLKFEESDDEDDDDATEEEIISETVDDNITEIVIKPNKAIKDPYIPETKLFTRLYKENVLPVFMKARQLCIYPAMLQKTIYDNKGMISNQEDLVAYYKSSIDTKKLDTLVSFILRRRDNKKIIFCYFKREIDYLSHKLTCMNIQTKVIDGRTSTERKNSILKMSPEVLILQIQTSCEGLNLQQYSEIYFTSPHWNPAIENQAIARCHRTGQKKNVNVFKFIFTGTIVRSIEEYILRVQNHKSRIVNKIL